MVSRTNTSNSYRAICNNIKNMDKKTTIGIIIGAMALTGAAVHDASTFSDSEITRVKAYAGHLNTTEDYILTEVLKGEVPQFDTKDITTEEISRAYVDVAKKLGDSLDGPERNLYNRIRTESFKHD